MSVNGFACPSIKRWRRRWHTVRFDNFLLSSKNPWNGIGWSQKNPIYSITKPRIQKPRAPLKSWQNSASGDPLIQNRRLNHFLSIHGFVSKSSFSSSSARVRDGELLNTLSSQFEPPESDYDLRFSPFGLLMAFWDHFISLKILE